MKTSRLDIAKQLDWENCLFFPLLLLIHKNNSLGYFFKFLHNSLAIMIQRRWGEYENSIFKNRKKEIRKNVRSHCEQHKNVEN